MCLKLMHFFGIEGLEEILNDTNTSNLVSGYSSIKVFMVEYDALVAVLLGEIARH